MNLSSLSSLVSLSSWTPQFAGYVPLLCLIVFRLGTLDAIGGGTVVAWGGNQYGQSDACAEDAVAISAGNYHTLLLKSDGTVVACGTGVEVPPDLRNVVAIASGWHHGLALLADGTVRAWGLSEAATNVPAGLSNVIAISATEYHNLALRRDGTVVGWGMTAYGAEIPVPDGLTNIVAISAGKGNLALRGDGTVVGWGMSTGSLSTITNAVGITAGWDDRFVLKADGTVDVEGYWGSIPAGVTDIEGIVASPGNDHHISLALLRDGTVRGWGFNFYAGSSPMVPAGLTGIVAVAPGGNHCAVLRGGGPPFITTQPVSRTVVMSGQTSFRVQATGAYPLSYQWKLRGEAIPGATRSLLILTNLQPDQAGEYTVQVSNAVGQSTSSSASLYLKGLQIDRQPESQTQYLSGTAGFEVVVRGLEPLRYQWRHNGNDLPGATERTLEIQGLAEAHAGAYSVKVTNEHGEILSSSAQLTVQPVVVTEPPKDQVSYPGGNVSFSVASSGVMPISYQWMHGGVPLPGATGPTLELASLRAEQAGAYSVLLSNVFGQLESAPATLHMPVIVSWGDLPQDSVPPDLTNVLAIASGSDVNLALTSDRHVRAWNNVSYRTDSTNVPPDATNIAAISIGGYSDNSFAIRSDGTIVHWGVNSLAVPEVTNLVTAEASYFVVGLCADGTMVSPSYPHASPTNLVAVSTGIEHGLALQRDGSVIAWGNGNHGQATIPLEATNVIAVSAYNYNSMALRADGTVVVWGDNWQGQTNVPPGLSNVVRIAAGDYHCMALKSDGTVVVWGDNWKGQTNIPPGLTNVVAIAGGGRHCLALVGDSPPVLHARALDPVLTDDTFSFKIPTESGRVYLLEQSSNPSAGSWDYVMLKLGTGEPIQFTVPGPLQQNRYFRVRDW
jgi:alpha-tubulin suppressor-like RCC1 family protein